MIDQKAQKALITRQILALKDSVTPADKTAAEANVPISRPTLEKYLSGDIVKVDKGEKLLRFFSTRIKERIEGIRTANLI